jgi:hypothetical protein
MGILDDIQNGKPIRTKPKLDFSMLVRAINQSIEVTDRAIDSTKEKTTKPCDDKPPQLPETLPLGYLITERQTRQDMEDGIWEISVIVETLKIDDLVKPTDFANNIAYQNHKLHIINTTPADTFPGFRIKIKVGQTTSSKRVIMPCVSKQEVMYSKQFIDTLSGLLEIVKNRLD